MCGKSVKIWPEQGFYGLIAYDKRFSPPTPRSKYTYKQYESMLITDSDQVASS